MANGDFKTVVAAVDKMFKTNSIYTTWVKFQISSLTIDSSSTTNDYFMHLENEKNGSGSANKFTLEIVFVPKILDGTGVTDADIIDKQLAASGMECTITYGYSSSDANLQTVSYSGMMLDYSVEIRDGALFYTITGISSVVKANEKLMTFDSKEQPAKPTDVFKEVVESELGPLGYKIDSGSANDDSETDIKGAQNVTVFQYLSMLMGMAKCSTDTEETPPEEVSTYSYIISDKASDKNIKIIKLNPKQSQVSVFTFNWMNPRESGSNIVIDFKTEFKGIMLLNRKYIDENGEDFKNITPLGEVVSTGLKTKNKPTDGKEDTNSKTQERVTWANAIQHSYKATLTLVGIPCEVPIGTCITVNPLILGKAHHTKGKYMILKSTDQIDSGGFITTLELMKITDQSTDKKEE